MTCAKKNPTRFYCKFKTRIKQGCDKKMYSKLMLNKLKVIKNPTFIYTLRDLIQKRFCESFISMCGP